MRTPTAIACARLTSSLCAAIALASCADTSIVYRDKPVPVPTPVYVALPPELLELRYPRFLYPAGRMPVGALEDKVESLELALGMCNNDKELIRAKQPKDPK